MEKASTKIARSKTGIDTDDRLSSLPDEVISHILSFLETKYAVGTAVLSRRWKDHWARVSNVDLDNRLAYKPLTRKIAILSLPPNEKLKYGGGKPPVPDRVSENLGRRDLEFCRFVDKVLGQHKNLNSLRRFRFHYQEPRSNTDQASPDFRFDRELVFGPLVEEIDVWITGKTEFGIPQCMRALRCLPQSFYTLKNLKVAKLRGVILVAIDESVFLHSLKILQLYYVETKDFVSLDRLLSGCPALETAHLVNCFPSVRNENDIIDVCLPSLKNLKICDFRYDDDWDDTMCAIVIEAPNLEDLYFDVYTNLQLGGTPFPRLHSAHVDIGHRGTSEHALIGVLTRISNAKKLSLSRDTLIHLVNNPVPLPVFPNLKHLTIQFWGNNLVLRSLLHSASKLHSLVINMQGTPEQAMEWEVLEHLQTPKCLLSSLEEIEVNALEVDEVEGEDEMKMVSYLLEAGVVLKKVKVKVYTVGYHLDVKGHKRLVSLLKLSRRSSGCEVRLLLPNNEEVLIGSDD